METIITLTCAPNFRDLGGLSLGDGSVLGRRRIYRSEAIHAPDARDAAQLASLGIRNVIDLRSHAERNESIGYWPGQDVEVHHVELAPDPRRMEAFAHLRADPSGPGVRRFLTKGYQAFPNACAPAVKTMFELAAMQRSPLLIHCTAGKDRTGFLIAMLLTGLGAPFDAVVADYLTSSGKIYKANIEGSRFAVDHRLDAPLGEDAVHELIGVREEFLRASMDVIMDDYGSFPDYLAAIGVSRPTIDRARLHLVA